MGTLVRTETLVHKIGAEGRVSVKTISGRLRVGGVDGEEVKLTVSYRIRAGDQAAAERALETGRVLVDRGPSWLDVETPERRISTGLAWLFGGARVGADISLEVPWGTKVRIETMSGSIEAIALVGEQKYRTVSGDVRLWGLGGLIEASSISGQVTLENGGDVRLKASSVSGAVKAKARCFYGMAVNTTSGGIAVAGMLDPSGDYRADSISGSVSLAPLSGVTAELRTISGGITSELENRVEGGRGFWRAIVGDGRSLFKANSTSGGLRILAPGRDGAPAQPNPAGGARGGWPESPTTGTQAGAATAAGTEESWTLDDAAAASEPPETDRRAGPDGPSEELAVLRALERGEISVDEAASRLEKARRMGDA
jgi:hypothetical protein